MTKTSASSATLSQSLLGAAVAKVQDVATASVVLDPHKNEVAASVWAYLVTVVWDEGKQRATHADKLDWRDRGRKFTNRARGTGRYAEACLAVQLVCQEWQERFPDDPLPWHENTGYAMARAITFCHEERWLAEGGIEKYGAVNPDDMVALIEHENGCWNIYVRHRCVEQAKESAMAAVASLNQITDTVTAISAIVATSPAAAKQEAAARDLLQKADSKSKSAGIAADEAATAVRWQEAKQKAKLAQVMATEIESAKYEAQDYYRQAVVGSEKPENAPEEPGTPEPSLHEPVARATPKPSQPRQEPQDEVQWLEAALQASNHITVEDQVLILVKMLGERPIGTLRVEIKFDDDGRVVAVEPTRIS